MTATALTPQDFHSPAMLLSGPVDYAMYREFRRMLVNVPSEGLVVIELSTLGGGP